MFRIGDLELQRLSGPVSFRYLVPKEDVFRAMAAKNVFLPIVILLGDTHFSEADRCDNCDEKNGCYKVESKTLLSKINTFASYFSVDFYTEFRTTKLASLYEGVLSRRFENETWGCHNTHLRLSPFYDCDYPNIRWHYADARSWKLNEKVESFCGLILRYLETLATSSISTRVISCEQADTPESLRLFPCIMLHKFMVLLEEAYTMNYTAENLAEKWSKVMSDMIVGNPNSIIYKQLARYEIDLNVQMFCYISIMNQLTSFDTKRLERKGMTKEVVTKLKNYMLFKQPLDIAFDYKNVIKMIRSLWILLTSSLLDLYFIARMLKTPKDNINSYLTLGFFGDAHSKHISNFLVRDWYDMRMESTSDQLRCQSFSGVSDLLADLKSYSQMRSEYQAKYHHPIRLLAENFSRSNPTLDSTFFRPFQRTAPALLTESLLMSLVPTGGWPLTPRAVDYLNDLAGNIIRALIPDHTFVSFASVVSAGMSASDPAIKNVLEKLYTKRVEKLDPAVIDSLIQQFVNVQYIERSAIAAIGNVIHHVLSFILSTLVIDSLTQTPFLIQRSDVQTFAASLRLFQAPPFGPIPA